MPWDMFFHSSPIFSHLGATVGESLGGRARWGHGGRVGNVPPAIWGAAGGQEPATCHPDLLHGSAQPKASSYTGNSHKWVKQQKDLRCQTAA